MTGSTRKTAFVLAGGGSFGAIQVGMLHELIAHGIRPDFIVGSSVGALNGAYFAGNPTAEGVARLEGIWCGLKRLVSKKFLAPRIAFRARAACQH